MAFDSLGRYVGTHKAWDHYGNVIPDIEHSEGIRPAFPFKPAAWLPVQFYDKYFEQWNVIMPGKLVSLDPDGRVIPSHLGLASSGSVTYTANDVAAGTIDIATGVAVTTANTTRTLTDIDGSTLSFMGRGGQSYNPTLAKYPIGVAPYAYHQWCGDGSAEDDGFNPAAFKENNYNMQHQVAVLCDYVIKLPLVPGVVSTETPANNWSAGAITFGTKAVKTRAVAIASTDRYGTTGFMPITAANVAPVVLDNYPVAKNTTRTPITSTVTGALAVEKDDVNAISVAGDFFVDYAVGVLWTFSSGGTSLPAVTGGTITYYHYATAPTNYSVFACVLGTTTELRPGDFLTLGTASNWVRATVTGASEDTLYHMGQVLGFEDGPVDALDRVRTAFNPALRTNASGAMSAQTLATSSVGLGQMDQMPGSATGGVGDAVHYSGAANRMVVINLIGR